MYTALEQSKYGRAKLNKDNLYCELKGQNMVDCYNWVWKWPLNGLLKWLHEQYAHLKKINNEINKYSF